jgi:hypothetical protein
MKAGMEEGIYEEKMEGLYDYMMEAKKGTAI